ncbi:hypothetical protein CLOM_g13559 [Closterium sp. NIES-68]|nr:hypothetical protein CLOM_g13559 [Closterium sp. NIES-68]GJP68687.1 hypothetical protein CLOP_g25347 [Closterium sp. NIES-67]
MAVFLLLAITLSVAASAHSSIAASVSAAAAPTPFVEPSRANGWQESGAFTASAVSVLAGRNGSYGLVDDRGEAARFNNPTHLAADCHGNLFVVDQGNFYLRVISPHGDVTTVRQSSDTLCRPILQQPSSHSTQAPPTTVPPESPGRALLGRTGSNGEASVHAAQHPNSRSKPHHGDEAKLGSAVSGMWYNASSGVLYVVDSGRQRIAAFAPAAAAGNAAGYVALSSAAAAGAAAASGVSFEDSANIPGCLCNSRNSSGGGHDDPPSSPWLATWRNTGVAGGGFAAGVLCAHGKPLLTAAAAGTSHVGSTMWVIIQRVASTGLAVLLLLFSLPHRFMRPSSDHTTTTTTISSDHGPLVVHPSTEQQGGGGQQQEQQRGEPAKATLLSLVWPFRSPAAASDAPTTPQGSEESGLLISFSDEEEEMGDGKAVGSHPRHDASCSVPPGAPAPVETLQAQSSTEIPVTIAATAGSVPVPTCSSGDSTARVMTGVEFDDAVASGHAASATGHTATTVMASRGGGVNLSSADPTPCAATGPSGAAFFSDLVKEQMLHTWVQRQ